MAIEISNEVVNTLITERIMQNARNFNTGTKGTIVPLTDYHQGDFEEELFFKPIGDLRRRDPNNNNTAVVDTLDNSKHRAVKIYLYKKLSYKLTDIKRYGKDPDALAVRIGEDLGDLVTVTMLNKGLIGAIGAIGAGNNTVYDGSSATPDMKTLNQILRLFGDNIQALQSWVLNSNAYFNLNNAGIDSSLDTVASGILYNATPATMGRNAYVTDSTALTDADGNDIILGLQSGGVVVKESEERELIQQIKDDGENLALQISLETAFTVSIKGYAYKDTAGANPDDATLGASANWEQAVSDIKAGAGVYGKVKSA